MRSESLIVLGNLFAKVFRLHFEQGFRILLFQPRDEQAKETADEIREPFPHFPDSPFSFAPSYCTPTDSAGPSDSPGCAANFVTNCSRLPRAEDRKSSPNPLLCRNRRI